MGAAGVKKLTLSTITPNSINFFIVGVIIAKRTRKTFISKRDGVERGVWGFTLRDSPTDYINVTTWGTPSYVEYLSMSFRIGDVVDLLNPKVSLRKSNDHQDRFQPSVTSCLELAINEHFSNMTIHDADDCINYIRLLHIPTRPPGNYLTLGEIRSNGNSDVDVNMLVAVQKIGVSNTFTSKSGEKTTVFEFIVMDKTYIGFTIQIWNSDLIERAKFWKPRDTVLFLSDVRVKWQQYRQTLCGEIGPRTIITENPNSKEAMSLAQYASTAPLQPSAILDTLAELMPLPESIINVMSCEALLNQARYGNNERFTALVYALVERFNVDGHTPIISSKCFLCKKVIGSVCDNPTCVLKPDHKSPVVIVNYDLRISLIDLTNVLSNCRLTGNNGATVLGCSSEDFHELSNEEKVKLKWKYLFKHVAARLLVMPSPNDPIISVISLNLISMSEFAQKIPIQ